MSRHGAVYLALDVGDARIGVAISRSGVLAQPLMTIERRGRKQVLDELEALTREHTVTDCVLGLPVLEGGRPGEQAEKTRAFSRSLQRRLPALRLHFQDERYSSAEAEEIAAAKGYDQPPRALIDRLAAAVILRDFLHQRGTEVSADSAGKEREPDEQS